MNTLFYYSGKRARKDGCAPIYFRKTENGKRTERSTGIFCSPEEWEARRQNGIEKRLQLMLKSLCSPPGVEKALLTWFDEYCADHFKTIKASTQKKFTGYRKNLLTFPEMSRLAVGKIDRNAVRRYQSHLARSGFTPCHVRKNCQVVIRTLNYATEKGAMSFNPCANMKFPRTRYNTIRFHTASEIEALANHRFASERLSRVRDLYLFQIETGMSYIDAQTFNPAMIHVEDGVKVIRYNRAKDTTAVVPLTAKAQEIIDRYSGQLPKLANANFNAYIKEVALMCGIEWNVTTHVARKTFAMRLLNSGVSMAAVSRMLGHTTVRTTESHYAKTLSDFVVSEIRKSGIKLAA